MTQIPQSSYLCNTWYCLCGRGEQRYSQTSQELQMLSLKALSLFFGGLQSKCDSTQISVRHRYFCQHKFFRYHKKLENFRDETGTGTKWDHTSKKLESVEAQIEMAWDSLKDADEGGCSLGSHKLTEVILGYWLRHSEPSKNVKHWGTIWQTFYEGKGKTLQRTILVW